jgi:hypothetical protein
MNNTYVKIFSFLIAHPIADIELQIAAFMASTTDLTISLNTYVIAGGTPSQVYVFLMQTP